MHHEIFISNIICPNCKCNIKVDNNKTICESCKSEFYTKDNIPILLTAKATENNFNYIEHYETDAETFDYFAESKGETAHEEQRTHQYILKYVEKNVRTVLDVGSGGAWVAKELCKTGKSVFSFDISFKNVKKALKKVAEQNHFGIVGDALNIPFKENSFDCIISSEVIEHLTNPILFIEQLIKILKPNGKLIITTPYKEKIQYTLCVHCNKETPVNAHLHSFDEDKLLDLFSNGSKKVVMQKFSNKILIHFRTSILLKFFSFGIWKTIDKFFNKLYNKPQRIIIIYTKTASKN